MSQELPTAFDLTRRSDVLTLYRAIVRGNPISDSLRRALADQFDAGLAVAKSRSERAFAHFQDLARELVKLGVIDQSRMPAIPEPRNLRALADENYRVAVDSQNSQTNNSSTSTQRESA